MPKRVLISRSWGMTDTWIEKYIGAFPEEHDSAGKRLIERVYSGHVDVYRHDGALLFKIRPRTIEWALAELIWKDLRRAARQTTHRPIAAAGQVPFHSGTIGFMDGKLTFATTDNMAGYRRIQLLLANMARVFARVCPRQYEFLLQKAKESPEFIIPGAEVFTSAAINLWSNRHKTRMAVHRDAGNLEGAYGVMTVIHARACKGGEFVLPQWRCGAELGNCDVMIVDNSQAHGNLPCVFEGDAERISVVAYYRPQRRLTQAKIDAEMRAEEAKYLLSVGIDPYTQLSLFEDLLFDPDKIPEGILRSG